MTITKPVVEERGWSDDGPSLLADPWSDDWTLPTAEELKAVGWPGARPGRLVDASEVAADLEPLERTVDETAEPVALQSPPGHLPPPPAPSA
jgi:hypothetical protein